MKDSKIEWCDHTFNSWIGCTRVSPGCVNCYAEQMMDKRMKQVKWGPGYPRKRTHERSWNAVRRWNRLQEVSGTVHHGGPRPRVFCASLADWLDPEVPVEWLADLLGLIHETPHLDWLLLTKRPELWHVRMGAVQKGWDLGGDVSADAQSWLSDWIQLSVGPANVWVGTTVEDQKRADERIPELLRIPARVRFLSCEPLLGPVDLPVKWEEPQDGGRPYMEIDWVISGGESGPNARPMHPDWARSLRDQCEGAGVPFFFKQWGEWAPGGIAGIHIPDCLGDKMDEPSHYHYYDCDAPCKTWRVGKHRAGRMLDGREHSAFPEVRS